MRNTSLRTSGITTQLWRSSPGDIAFCDDVPASALPRVVNIAQASLIGRAVRSLGAAMAVEPGS